MTDAASTTRADLDALFNEADTAGRTLIARCHMLEAVLTARLPAPAKPRRQRQPRLAPPDGLRTMAETAGKLGCSIKTLKGHIDAGALCPVTIGHGTKRPHKRFLDADINAFIQTRKDSPPCPSSAPHVRVTGTSISGTKIIAFTAQPRPRTGAKPKK